jgi:rhodanese-related sulfurtransferase
VPTGCPSNRFLLLSPAKNNGGQSGCKLQYHAIVFCLRKKKLNRRTRWLSLHREADLDKTGKGKEKPGGSMTIKQTLTEAVVLILAAAGIAIAIHAIRPDRIAPISDRPAGGAAQTVQQIPGGREISIEEARQLFHEKSVVFADARQRADYEAGHIQGAVHLDAAEPDAWLPEFLPATDPATRIVTYCDGESCPLAEELAELLRLNGFENVATLKNGLTRWRQSGLPVE